jgi:hypothetical protein
VFQSAAQGAAAGSPGTFDQTDLDFQVNQCYTTWPVTTPLCQPVANNAKFDSYVALWNGPPSDGKTQIRVKGLTPQTADYSNGPLSLGPPASIPDNGQSRTMRNVIALQQCTGCHGSETNTDLQHVSEDGNISNFLLPARTEWDVDLDSLKRTTVRYCVAPNASSVPSGFGAPVCPPGARQVTSSRIFHDLARRKLFMASVLAASDVGDDDYIMNYAPDFAH